MLKNNSLVGVGGGFSDESCKMWFVDGRDSMNFEGRRGEGVEDEEDDEEVTILAGFVFVIVALE